MARRVPGIGAALLLGLPLALAVGSVLALRDARPAAAPAPPTAIVQTVPLLTATTPPITLASVPVPSPASAPTADATGTPAPTSTATILPTITPAPTWVVVGRWTGSQLHYTEEFTVRGPWRIRWRLSAASESFQLMIEDGSPLPELITAEPGALVGIIPGPGPGTFALMLHNTIPYEVIVEEWRIP